VKDGNVTAAGANRKPKLEFNLDWITVHYSDCFLAERQSHPQLAAVRGSLYSLR